MEIMQVNSDFSLVRASSKHIRSSYIIYNLFGQMCSSVLNTDLMLSETEKPNITK